MKWSAGSLVRPGDGYYESCILAVENNLIEVTV